jgi:hypothetical protein
MPFTETTRYFPVLVGQFYVFVLQNLLNWKSLFVYE